MDIDAASSGASPEARQQRLAILARAPEDLLEQAWQNWPQPPHVTPLRAPETGLIMTTARAGGAGQAFHMGEVTVSRAVVRLAGGTLGYGYVLGQRPRHAELVACFDALAAEGSRASEIREHVLAPAARRIEADERDARGRAEATRVDFSTLVREG